MRHRRRHISYVSLACFVFLSTIEKPRALATQRRGGSAVSNLLSANVIDNEGAVIQDAAEQLLLATLKEDEYTKPRLSYEIFSPDLNAGAPEQVATTAAPPLGNCPAQKPSSAPLACPTRPRQHECQVHTDCPPTYLCCIHGCTKRCTRLREHDGAAEPETVHPTLACAQLNCSRLGRVCVRRQSVRGVTRSFCVHALYAKKPCDAPESRCEPGDTCQTGRSCNIWGECKYMAVCVVTGDD